MVKKVHKVNSGDEFCRSLLVLGLVANSKSNSKVSNSKVEPNVSIHSVSVGWSKCQARTVPKTVQITTNQPFQYLNEKNTVRNCEIQLQGTRVFDIDHINRIVRKQATCVLLTCLVAEQLVAEQKSCSGHRHQCG